MSGFDGLSQSEEEQLALDQFRSTSGLLPGKDERVQTDPPDFVITNGGRRIAVETTRLHSGAGEEGGSIEAKREGNVRLLAARAQRLFEAEHPDLHVEVRPHVMDGLLTGKKDVYPFVPLLAAAVADATPPAPSGAELVTRATVYPADLQNERLLGVISFIDITRWRPERWKAPTSSMWLLGSGGRVKNDLADMESRIRDKEHDLDRYQAEFDGCWLLIYAVPLASSWFDFEVLQPRMFSSRFDGVAFVDVFNGQNCVIAEGRSVPAVRIPPG